MNIARVVSGLGILSLVTACAAQRSEKSAEPAMTPQSTAGSAESTLDQQGLPAAAPAPAPAPPGLDRPKSAESRADEEFTTLEAAERALNQAKADLDRLALAGPAPNVGRSAAEKKDTKPGAPSAAGAGATPSAAPPAQCEQACRAFASLTRAASAVCRLDGENGAHCSHAKQMVSASERRVANCTCPAPGQ